MGEYHQIRFPNETEDYRQARDELLKAELELRDQLAQVAKMRAELPLGGEIQEDYVFDEGVSDPEDLTTIKKTRFSQLFEPGKKTLIVYSFMFGPDDDKPCPLCNSLLDSTNANMPHLRERVNLAVVAKAPMQKLKTWAISRGWGNLRLLSSLSNGYNQDYHAEDVEWGQLPAVNVFHKDGKHFRHFYNTEMLYAKPPEGLSPRHADLLWPLWNFFDLTPEGRGRDWFPKLDY